MRPQMTNRMKQAAVDRITKRIVSESTRPDILASTIAIDVQCYLDERIEKMGLSRVFEAVRIHGLDTVLEAVDSLWYEDVERMWAKFWDEHEKWLAEQERNEAQHKEEIIPPTYEVPIRQRLFQPGSARGVLTKLLPTNWSKRHAEEVLKHFGGCALSDETQDIVLDHFIPVSWGHGGTYVGNMIPLSKKLNRLKDNRNPFEWVQDREVRRLIKPSKWDDLLAYLAGLHDVSVVEFERYVVWCSDHRRRATEPIRFSSFTLWRSSV